MIDPTSVFIGLFVGVCIGVLIGVLRTSGIVDELKAENTELERDLRRLTTRDRRGRFTRVD